MSSPTKRALATTALRKSIDVRTDQGLDLVSPLDVYALCERLRIQVRFADISMEGMYVRDQPPRIILSALRPLARRVYTCGHEIGHHVFGHGSTIDELREDLRVSPAFQPQEFLVQSFAGFLLMPTLGVRKAFTVRGWSAATATPAQLFTVACSFGVGFTTLVYHLAYGLEMIPGSRADLMQKVTLPSVRRELLGATGSGSLIITDRHWGLRTLDAEVGMQLLLPIGAEVEGDLLTRQMDLPNGRLFEAIKPGIARAWCETLGWNVFVRVSRRQYVGLSRYRHLEDDGEEEMDDE